MSRQHGDDDDWDRGVGRPPLRRRGGSMGSSMSRATSQRVQGLRRRLHSLAQPTAARLRTLTNTARPKTLLGEAVAASHKGSYLGSCPTAVSLGSTRDICAKYTAQISARNEKQKCIVYVLEQHIVVLPASSASSSSSKGHRRCDPEPLACVHLEDISHLALCDTTGSLISILAKAPKQRGASTCFVVWASKALTLTVQIQQAIARSLRAQSTAVCPSPQGVRPGATTSKRRAWMGESLDSPEAPASESGSSTSGPSASTPSSQQRWDPVLRELMVAVDGVVPAPELDGLESLYRDIGMLQDELRQRGPHHQGAALETFSVHCESHEEGQAIWTFQQPAPCHPTTTTIPIAADCGEAQAPRAAADPVVDPTGIEVRLLEWQPEVSLTGAVYAAHLCASKLAQPVFHATPVPS